MSVLSNVKQKQNYALKQQAMNYYEDNKVPVEMENVLNTMFFDKPPDVYGYLVNHFGQFCKPATISQLTATQVLDSSGLLTIQTDVYCTVNNLKKCISSSMISRANIRLNLEDQEKSEEQINASVKAAVKMINSEINNRIEGLDPSAQEEIDSEILSVLNLQKKTEVAIQSNYGEKLDRQVVLPQSDRKITGAQSERKMTFSQALDDDKVKKNLLKNKNGKASTALALIPDRPLEMLGQGCEAAAAVSQAVCVCAATSKDTPVYQHIAHLAQQNESEHYLCIPIPMVTIIESGKSSSGKVVCVKEFIVVPGINMSTDESIEHIQQIFNFVSKHMVSKYGLLGKLVNETGALCPPLETVTQALDILIEAVKAQGLTIDEDIYLAINCAGHESYDHEKGKYETLTGQFKSPDEMVDFWHDIIQKYPSIIAVIDPIRGEDIEQWMHLCEKISYNVLVIGDTFFERPGIICRMELPVQTSGIVIHVEKMNTVSDIISCAKKYQDCSNELVISANQIETNDTFIVDLAVGLGARFLKVGGLSRGERTCKLNRLVQICNEITFPVQIVGAELKKEATSTVVDDLESMQHDFSSLIAETSGSKKVYQITGTWKEGQKTQLKTHAPFTFPLIKNTQSEIETEEMPVEVHL